jgi:acyl carrier protein
MQPTIPTDRVDIEAKVRGIVIDALRLGARNEALGPDTPLESLGLDSLNIMDILTGMERTFGLTFDDSDLDFSMLDTVASLTDYVQSTL